MALLGLAVADANQPWTTYPTKLKADGVRADASSLNGIGEITQPLLTEATDDVGL
jgi:hypothetical protein